MSGYTKQDVRDIVIAMSVGAVVAIGLTLVVVDVLT